MSMSEQASRTCIEVSRAPHGGRIVARFRTTAPPERPSIRPLLVWADDRRARVSLIADGALLLAGDRIEIDVRIGPGAQLELIEPAGTVAYSMNGQAASWHVSLDLAPLSSLIWAAEPFVVSEGATVERSTSICLGWDATLAMREVIVLGRHDERPGSLDQRLDVIAANGAPILSEHLRIGPQSGPLWLGGSRVIGSVMVLGGRLPDLGFTAHATVLDLAAAGTVVRALADDAHRAVHGWAQARRLVEGYATEAICSRTVNSRSSAAAM